MCGFFGWISKNTLTRHDLESCHNSLETLSHRGPDGEGAYTEPNLFIGHKRLSIIDLNTQSSQPFIDPTGRYILCFNGEIYNYIELKLELSNLGVSFTTNSDTEVFLQALIHWGIDALSKVDGMFAGSFYDKHKCTHLIFRDPLGQKPLYYCDNELGLIYSSELRGILALKKFRFTIDHTAFSRYILNGYYALEDTPIFGVHKLLPGYVITYKDESITTSAYWKINLGDVNSGIKFSDAVNMTEELLYKSCKQSLRSDAPYGVFLSGGLDSSLILAISKSIDSSIKSFSIGVDDPDYDESLNINKINNQFSIKNSHIFRMDSESASCALNNFLSSLDEPHADPGFINMLFLSHNSSPFIKVALSGDGGDELFCGYAPFKGLKYSSLLDKAGTRVPTLLKNLTKLLPENDGYLGLKFKLSAYLRGFPSKNQLKPSLWLSAINTENLEMLVKNYDFNCIFNATSDVMSEIEGGDLTNHLIFYYQKIFLPEFILHHTDRASMRNGIETRAPFLSKPLVEYANMIPNKFKYSGGHQKLILKEIAKRYNIPKNIIYQPKKGFSMPMARWLKNLFLAETMNLKNSQELTGLINFDELNLLIDNHLSGVSNNYRILFSLIAFKHWRINFPSVTHHSP